VAHDAYGAIRKYEVIIMGMDLEKAIKTAIEFETRVKAVYKEASEQVTNPVGKKVFEALAEEEQGHLDYLNYKLDEWQTTGKITQTSIGTKIPTREAIENETKKIEGKVHSHDEDRSKNTELKMLNNAREVEIETGNFYKQMVKELPKEGQELFTRFVEIEEGHLAIVQAEIDYISGPGYWFDFKEFDLAGGA
jgi:rubrerythrin